MIAFNNLEKTFFVPEMHFPAFYEVISLNIMLVACTHAYVLGI